MLKLPLEQGNRTTDRRIFKWKAAPPFVENARGVLTHRLRSGATYNIHRNPHIAVSFWCGLAVSDSKGNLTFTDNPSDGAILCARCEAIAIENGLLSADSITGRHIHKGRVKPVITCCEVEQND